MDGCARARTRLTGGARNAVQRPVRESVQVLVRASHRPVDNQVAAGADIVAAGAARRSPAGRRQPVHRGHAWPGTRPSSTPGRSRATWTSAGATPGAAGGQFVAPGG